MLRCGVSNPLPSQPPAIRIRSVASDSDTALGDKNRPLAAKFWSAANDVVTLDDDARYQEAVDRALGDQANASASLDASIRAESAKAQARFDDAARDAHSGFAVLAVALTLGLLLAAVLVLVGLQPRIREYQ